MDGLPIEIEAACNGIWFPWAPGPEHGTDRPVVASFTGFTTLDLGAVRGQAKRMIAGLDPIAGRARG